MYSMLPVWYGSAAHWLGCKRWCRQVADTLAVGPCAVVSGIGFGWMSNLVNWHFGAFAGEWKHNPLIKAVDVMPVWSRVAV